MKITSMILHIEEEDFEEYENVLRRMGWEEQTKHVFRKKFGNTSVEIREHLPTFGTTLELVVSFYNPDGCSIEKISRLLKELKEADLSPDAEEANY
ncbi:hypothetical protein [Ammoniphilus sp. 3BR4]|uniref:hypothetical protein n=1 Tax=Ammoniphilus sp. 3BR4 TaxID=3158265 RepID=UPI003467BC8D